MELIKGKTLKEIIEEEGRIPWKVAVDIAKQISSALEMAHKNGIVHRDIKPHNIIISDDFTVKVTDFGIAKAVTNATMTAFGSTIGSVHYFSPEHAKGTITDAKSDIYSIGIVMYEMVTGRVPFDADTPVSVALKQVQEKPIEPISINPEIPEGLNYIILKAMKKDKEERYNSANELLQDLEILSKHPETDFSVFNQEGIVSQMTKSIPIVKNRRREDEKNKKKTLFEQKPWLKWVMLGVAAIIVLIIIVSGTIFLLNQDRQKEAYIPNLAGAQDEKRLTKDEAIALFGNKEAGGIVLLKTYEEYYNGYEDDKGREKEGYSQLIEELQNKFPIGEQIIGEQNEKEFIILFGNILKIKNILSAFDKFAGNEILSEREYQDYQSIYIDLYQKRKPKDTDKESINDDIIFEIELIKQVEINIDYILMKVAEYYKSNKKDKEILIDIKKAIDSSIELRSKKELIEGFIDRVNSSKNVTDDFKKFVKEEKEKDLEKVIEEEKLKPEETKKFIDNSLRDGTLKTTGTDIDKLLPPVSRFGGGNRIEKKLGVIEKLKGFFDKYLGLTI